jgi:REP-associated tyrosine transposase
MPLGLKRYQQEGDDHFITFSCHHRKSCLNTPTARDIFLDSLGRTRSRYQFEILGYVVMPEHVHLLVSEPRNDLLSSPVTASSRQSLSWG